MAVLWPGHRWEDYQVRLIDNAWNPTDELGTTFKMRGVRSLYGQFKGELTFALDRRDPHAQFLLERELHFIQVLRDGHKAFEGFQIKLDREDTIADAERWIEFAFLPLAFLLHWRIGVCNENNKIDLNLAADELDDNFKYIVRHTLGPLAGTTPITILDRVMADFNVQADLSLGPLVAINATGQDVYEAIQQYAAAHKVDWDVVFDADFHPEFRTYYPRRGADRTEGGPGPDEDRCIFSDEQGNFVKQSYGQDTSDLKTVMYDRSTVSDIAAGPTRRGNWGLREGIIDSGQQHEIQVALNNADLKEWYKLEQFKEAQDKQWQQHFWTGDEVTWNSVRLGYGPHDDCLCMMEFEIDEAGFEILTPTFGKPEPDIRDNLRGGGRGRNRPAYTAPTIWHLYGDAATLVDPDVENAIGVIGGTNISVTEGVSTITIDGTGPAAADFVAPAFTFSAAHVIGASGDVVHSDSEIALGITCPDANTVYPLPAGPNRWTLTSAGGTVTITGAVANQVNFEVVPGAGCLWVRDNLDSGVGVTPGLHTGVAAEPVMIGADDADLTGTPWYATSGGTKLDVRGLVRVVRGLYCNEDSLALWGMDGATPKVHIVDESAAVGGAGGGACVLDVYNAAIRHVMLDTDIANASYVWGIFENRDGAGAICNSFNAVTGISSFNAQQLAGGDFIVASNAHAWCWGMDAGDDSEYHNAINYLWPAADGAAGSVLSTNGAGNLSWVAAGAPPATPWTDTGAVLHPTAARDVWGRAAGQTWKLISATGSAELGRDTNTISYIGRAAVGYCGHNDLATFCHLDSNTTTGYALLQGSTGATALNSATGQVTTFGINNVARMVMSATATMLYSGQDLELHSGAGGSLVASIDGATGSAALAQDANVASFMGRAAVGYCGWADYAAFAHVDHNTTTNYALIQGSAGETALNAATGQAIYLQINNAARMIMNVTDTMLYNSQNLKVYDGAPGNLKASIDGATGRIDSVDGYTKSGAAANRHVLIGDGTRGVFRALVAADLGGHVHVISGDTGAGTAHTHVITGDTGGATPNLTGETTGWLIDGAATYVAGANPLRRVGGVQVYMTAGGLLSTTAAGNTELLIGSAGHHHDLVGNTGGVTTNLATAIVDNHTHDEGTLVGANESAHTHDEGTLVNAGPS